MFQLTRKATSRLALRSSASRPAAAARHYSDEVVDHFENPRNIGTLPRDDGSVGVGVVGSPACGDFMQMGVRIEDGKVVDVKVKTYGCASAIAASSLASEWIKDKDVEDCLHVTNRDIAAYLKLPPVKLHCSMLAEEAIEAAIKDYKSKQQQAASQDK